MPATPHPPQNAPPGRSCPLRYRYGPAAIAQAPTRLAQTLYAVGGLYGNRPALDAIEQMASHEADRGRPAPTLCFNGDFNWFNTADAAFAEVNRRVLACDAIQGNVEAELDPAHGDAGCGCAYPDSVDAGVVERSNQIHARLKATALRHPGVLARLARLPMLARYQVGDCRVGVVHGDGQSLAGWGLDVQALGDAAHMPWLRQQFAAAEVDVLASTHTCLPALRSLALAPGRLACAVNNGAAGMPNFRADPAGLITRIATTASPHPTLHECRVGEAFVALLPVAFDTGRWQAEFLAQWPAGSPAWQSYWDRITQGPAFERRQVLLLG